LPQPKEGGHIEKILGHPALRQLKREEINFLLKQAEHPWRFSFSVITNVPAEDFYVMEDIFSAEQFLLFSPGITDEIFIFFLLKGTRLIAQFSLNLHHIKMINVN